MLVLLVLLYKKKKKKITLFLLHDKHAINCMSIHAETPELIQRHGFTYFYNSCITEISPILHFF